MEPFISPVSEEDIKREKIRARELRKSQWWKRKIAAGVCYFCGAGLHPRDLTMEHIVPLVRGGRSTRSNVVPACKECNAKKKYLLPSEWEEYREKLLADSWS